VSFRLGRFAFPLSHALRDLVHAAVLGLLTGLTLGREEVLLAGTAAVSSYTTFSTSTWMLETQRLGEDEQVRYLAVSLAAGVAVAAVGRWIGMQL
jgi:CrcB protein